MQLKRLKLSGFKSFVEPAELKIEPGLTGIVGPNGCGKSNLLEAIRWVMGENSPKSMRGGGMEDVIFAGTATRPSRDFAEVLLSGSLDEGEMLPGETGLADEDDSGGGDIEVVRRIERGAGSAYRLNSNDVRAKDIALLFADAATGAHSPALVSQGRIAAVISARPQQRRQMLEEAAGIAGLHVRRKDAETRLRATEANLEKLSSILSEMDGRIASLKRQARAAERYRELSDAITSAEARLIYARWLDAREQADKAKAEVDAVNALLAERGDAQKAAQTAFEQSTAALAEIRAKASSAREDMHSVAQKLVQREGEAERLADQQSSLSNEVERIERESGNEDRMTRDAAEALDQLRADLGVQVAQIQTLDVDTAPLRRAVETANEKLRGQEVSLATALADEARVDADRKVAQASLDTADRQHQARLSELDRLEQRQSQLPDIDELQQERVAAVSRVESLQRESERLAAQVQSELGKRDSLLANRQEAESAVAGAASRLAGLESEQAALADSLDTTESADRAIDRLKVDSGYEQALAAALGDDLNAGFSETGSQRRWTLNDEVPRDTREAPDGTVRLSQVVAAPDALAARLSAVFVADEDDGQSLALGQRLVTRDGRLRRWDGFVSVGDGGVAAERLRQANRLDELKALVETARQDSEAVQRTLDEARAALDATDQAIRKARNDSEAASEQGRMALRERDRIEDRLERAQRDRSELADQLAQKVAEREEAAEAVEQARKTVAGLSDGAAEKAKVAALQAALAEARDQIQQRSAALSSHEQEVARAREKKSVTEADLRNWQARLGEAEKRIVAMRERRGEVERALVALSDRPEQVRSEIERLAKEKADLTAALAGQEEALAAAEAEQRSREAALAQASEALAEARERRAGSAARAEHQDARRTELAREAGERFGCPPPMLPEKGGFEDGEQGSIEQATSSLEKLQADRERMGPVNLLAASELESLQAEESGSRAEAEELTEAIARLRGSIGQLNREGRQRLREAFEKVNGHFEQLFESLFGGGRAHLELVDSDDPLEAGLEIMAQPPGKKLSSLTLLSGGEQALTAVALIFGLFLTNPAPICVLDEVDAPLDDANVERFCDLLEKMTQQTQTRYLIVTHNAVTMSRMDRLFGVTMIEKGVSRLVSVDLGGAEELLGSELT